MKTTRTVAGVAALALLGAGCSSEAITERIAEKAAEQVAGGDVDIDLDEDGGDISIESSEGSMQMGAGGSVPDSFPQNLPLPDADYEVANSFETTNSEGELDMQLSLVASAPGEDLEAFLEQGLADAGWEVTDTRRQSMEDAVHVTFVAEQGGIQTLVTLRSDSPDETLVNYIVSHTAGS